MSNRTFFEDKRFLPQQRIKDTFFDYLLDRFLDLASRVWGGQRGVFGSLNLVSGGNDKFSVQTLPAELLDGDGNILSLDGADGTGIQFENLAATDYYVGARHNLIPSGVLRNQRNNVIFYDTEEDRIGEVGDPTSVTEVAGTLEIVVDSVFEAGVSHAGRLVTVWLRRALTTEESVAIERNLTVVWTGGVNKVVTSGLLGQAGGSASTDPTDYQVFAQGVTVRKADLSLVSPYAYIGKVTGGGAGNPPSAFSTLGQIDVSDGINPDLQEAYTAGREISPSGAYGGAVKIASADSGDALSSLLHLDRKGATETNPVDLALVMDEDGTGQLNVYPLSHSTVLQLDEPAQVNGGTDGRLDLTRGGVNVGTAKVRRDCDLVLLTGFATAAVNGLYKFASPPSGATVFLTRWDDGSVAGYWSGAGAEAGNASFLRLGVGISKRPEGTGTELQPGRPMVVNGSNETGDPAAVKLYPRMGSAALECFEGDSVVPRLQALLSKFGTFEGRTTGSPGTPANELYLADRLDNTDYMQLAYLALCGDSSTAPFAALQPVLNSPYLLAEEDVTLAGDIVTFTRGGSLDLTQKDGRINSDLNLLLLTDAANEADNGLYLIGSLASTFIAAEDMDGNTSSFLGASAKARLVIPKFLVGGSQATGGGSGNWLRGSTFVLRDPYTQGAAPLRIFTENQGGVEVYDGGKSNATSYAAPRTFFVLDPTVIGNDNAHPIKLHRATVVRGGGAGGGTEEDFHLRDGVRIYDAGGGVDTRDPAFALAVDGGFPEDLPTLHTKPAFAADTVGGVSRGHNFRDDFMSYDPTTAWTNAWPQPPHYYTFFVGAGTITPRDISNGAGYGHGCVELATGTNVSDVAELGINSICCNLDTAKDFRWSFRGRLKVGSVTNMTCRFGFYRGTGSQRYYFECNNGVWRFVYWNGAGYVVSAESCNATVGEYQWFDIYLSSSTVVFVVERKDHAAGSYMSGAYSIPNLDGQAGGIGVNCWIQTQIAAASKSCVLDYWEVFDTEVLYGRLGNSHNLNHP